MDHRLKWFQCKHMLTITFYKSIVHDQFLIWSIVREDGILFYNKPLVFLNNNNKQKAKIHGQQKENCDASKICCLVWKFGVGDISCNNNLELTNIILVVLNKFL